MSTLIATAIATSSLPSYKEDSTFNPTSFETMKNSFKSQINNIIVDLASLNTDKIDIADAQSPTGLWTFSIYPRIQTYAAPTEATQLAAKQYVDDEIAGVVSGATILSPFIILDADNASTEVDTAVRFNRGSTAADAQLLWDVSETAFSLTTDLSTLANLKIATSVDSDDAVRRDEVVLDTGAQAIAGIKTFSDIPVFSAGMTSSGATTLGTTTITGGAITNALLTLDSDNSAGAGVDVGFIFERGVDDAGNAKFFWDKSETAFSFLADGTLYANLKIATSVDDEDAVRRDEIFIADEAYGSGWNGVTDEFPTKNAVYDKVEAVVASTTIKYWSADAGAAVSITSSPQVAQYTEDLNSDTAVFSWDAGNDDLTFLEGGVYLINTNTVLYHTTSGAYQLASQRFQVNTGGGFSSVGPICKAFSNDDLKYESFNNSYVYVASANDKLRVVVSEDGGATWWIGTGGGINVIKIG